MIMKKEIIFNEGGKVTMGAKCPDCDEILSVQSTWVGLLADCWNCHKRYTLNIMTGLLIFVTYFDDEGNAIKIPYVKKEESNDR